jgi:hypothetical protein
MCRYTIATAPSAVGPSTAMRHRNVAGYVPEQAHFEATLGLWSSRRVRAFLLASAATRAKQR